MFNKSSFLRIQILSLLRIKISLILLRIHRMSRMVFLKEWLKSRSRYLMRKMKIRLSKSLFWSTGLKSLSFSSMSSLNRLSAPIFKESKKWSKSNLPKEALDKPGPKPLTYYFKRKTTKPKRSKLWNTSSTICWNRTTALKGWEAVILLLRFQAKSQNLISSKIQPEITQRVILRFCLKSQGR